MLKLLAYALLVVSFPVGVVVAYEAPALSPMACPSVTSQRAVKIGGAAAGYPASCALPVCRLMNSTAQKVAYVADPFCQFCPAVPVLQWRYKIQLGAVPSNACPADVVSGPWVQP